MQKKMPEWQRNTLKGWKCDCGYIARSSLDDRRHKENFPSLCKDDPKQRYREVFPKGYMSEVAAKASISNAGMAKYQYLIQAKITVGGGRKYFPVILTDDIEVQKLADENGFGHRSGG